MNNILEIKNRKNLKEDFSGMDYVYEKCLNKEHLNNYNKKVFDFLEKHHIAPVIAPFRHRWFWDGGVHCVTQDLYRERLYS